MSAGRPHSGAARKPPPSIAVIGAIFLALACLDLVRGFAPLLQSGHLMGDDLLVAGIGVAAGVGGAFVLAGHEWARWLLAAWMALHVALSIGDPGKLVAHVVIFGVLAFFLFRPRATAFFRRSPGD